MNGPDEGRGKDEGQRHADPVARQQHRALPRRVGARCREQDRREDRADAGRPPEGEGQPDQVGAAEPEVARVAHLAPPLPVQEADAEDAEEMQPHHDDQRRRDPAQHVEPVAHELPQRRRGCPEADEDREHARREEQRAQDGAPTHRARHRRAPGDGVDTYAGEVAKIEWNHRQNAGRQER
jgi:hypothetical protein